MAFDPSGHDDFIGHSVRDHRSKLDEGDWRSLHSPSRKGAAPAGVRLGHPAILACLWTFSNRLSSDYPAVASDRIFRNHSIQLVRVHVQGSFPISTFVRGSDLLSSTPGRVKGEEHA